MLAHRRPYLLFTLACFLLLLLAAEPSLAQMGGGLNIGGMGGPGDRGAHRDSRSDTREQLSDDRNPRDNAQRKFAELEARLALTETQRPYWLRYGDRVSALNGDLARNPGGKVTANDNAVQQIERKADFLRNRLAALEEIADAARALYQVLDPVQKKAADALLAQTIPGLFDNFQGGTPPDNDGRRPLRGSNEGGASPQMPSR
jgi:hypothetical protein